MPTGEDNFALLDAFQHNGYQTIQGGTGSMAGRAQHNIMKRSGNQRSYGRGTGGRRIGGGSQT
jgi:hypothetical protein